MYLELWYQRAWGALNMLTGILFSILFLLGAVVLQDIKPLLYVLLTAGNVYMGWVRLRKPYVICAEKIPGEGGTIKIYSSFNTLLHVYTYQHRTEITVKGNRLYQGNKRLKFNSWFTNKHQWEKIIRYYRDGALPADDLVDF